MKKNTNFFERLMEEASKNGYYSVNELIKALGYKSGEKLYRLKRDEKNKPGYDIIEDVTNLFENFDFHYLITGESKADYNIEETVMNVSDSETHYQNKIQVLKSLFEIDNSEVYKKIDDLSAIMAKFHYDLQEIKKEISDKKVNGH